MIRREGLYPEITEDEYHADPCESVSVSRSVLKECINKTPMHAFIAHPRLYTPKKEKTEDKFDLGTAAHSMLLNRGKATIEAPEKWKNWTTNAAKQWRADIRESGGTPLLQSQYEQVCEMVEAVRSQLPEHGLEHLFVEGKGKPEVCGIWDDVVGGWSRCMFDWLEQDLTITDVKTTDVAIDLESIARHCASMEYEIQDAFYTRCIEHLYPEMAGRVKFRFLFIEAKPPFTILPVFLPNDAKTKGRFRVERGMKLWRECLSSGVWPRHSGKVGDQTLEYPSWSVAGYEDYL